MLWLLSLFQLINCFRILNWRKSKIISRALIGPYIQHHSTTTTTTLYNNNTTNNNSNSFNLHTILLSPPTMSPEPYLTSSQDPQQGLGSAEPPSASASLSPEQHAREKKMVCLLYSHPTHCKCKQEKTNKMKAIPPLLHLNPAYPNRRPRGADIWYKREVTVSNNLAALHSPSLAEPTRIRA